jgi:cation-transporting P-type ATPase E
VINTSEAGVDIVGLSTAEFDQRARDGRLNVVDDSSSRSFGDIVRSNVFTRFNLVIAVLAGIVLALGEYRDALFSLVMVSNAAIGVIQELRSKATLDRLSLVAAPQLTVIRDARPTIVRPDQVVLDDVISVGLGDQIVVDGETLTSDALSVDESMLTGEADAVPKNVADGLLSGSFVVAGRGLMRATAVGDDAYAARLAKQARAFQRPRSELERGINSILRVVTWLIIPAAVGLFLAQRYGQGDTVHESLLGTVAGVVALVPQGLVLFLSMAQAVAVIRLGRAGVLVQRLEAVETLARVTLLATDKTGTLTSGAVVLDHVQALDENVAVDAALGAVAGVDEHPDPTMAAIVVVHPAPDDWTVADRVPFSSAYKYSAVDFGENGVWYIGAPEVLLHDASEVLESVQRAADQGMRVLVLARATELAEPGNLPTPLEPSALVVCTDEIRSDAKDTVGFFVSEQVTVKVISGDNPRTVAAIAERCAVPDSDRWVDGRTLPEDLAELAGHVSSTTVFGRVTPEVKRSLVQAAQQRGEVVAMTGDGVNDTLALKDADLGIAMGSGTPAAKSVAELVLLDNEFSTLPGVVAEGRRVIANIERVARLFVTKTIWAATFAVITGVFTMSYPLLPRQLTVVDAITIGIPGFVLSFEPSHEPIRTGFVRRVMRFCVPVGLVVGVVTMVVYGILRSSIVGADRESAQSGVTLLLTVLGLIALYELVQPLDRRRAALIVTMIVMLVGAYAIDPVADFFLLQRPVGDEAMAIAIGALVGAVGIVAGVRSLAGKRTNPAP